jgi:hypothetical protein
MGKDNQSDESSSSESPEISHSVIPEADIAESIIELEDLIVETKFPPKLFPEIPVLNNIVDPAEARQYAQSRTSTESTNGHEDKLEDFPSDRLNELVNKVDRNLSKELDSLVDILKDTIKDSIISELKEQLKKEAHQIGLKNYDTQNSLKHGKNLQPTIHRNQVVPDLGRKRLFQC